MNDLPTTVETKGDYGIDIRGMAPGLALMFNQPLYERCKDIARIMADAQGITPPHLIGKKEACFAVVTRAITWKLDPFAVAQSTYDVGGKVGYEGKLVQAILENSGYLIGNVKFELFGDWNKLRGKFTRKQGERGKMIFTAAWKDEDEIGLGVWVRANVKGEDEPRELEFFLNSAWPRNSLLWATRPEQQIKYAAVRAFANTVAPGLFMGVPFRDDEGMIDVTPDRPRREDFASQVAFNGPQEPAEAETADEPTDPETGEIKGDTPAAGADTQAPAPEEQAEPTRADLLHAAYQLGMEHFDKGRSMFSAPQAYDEEMKAEFADGWREGERMAKLKAQNGEPE